MWLVANAALTGLLVLASRRSPIGRRAIATLCAAIAGALIGFNLGALFPTGSDPKYVVFAGWLESGAIGMRIGAAVCGGVAMGFWRQLPGREFLVTLASVVTIAIATVPFEWSLAMAYFYWYAPFGTLPRVLLLG
ncbi:MAG: hypothetical protein ACJ790_11705 [Myxococcaceae bacterium]